MRADSSRIRIARRRPAQEPRDSVRGFVKAAIPRLRRELDGVVPYLATRVADWITTLSPTNRAADYFDQPWAFPMLLLPCWLAQSLGTENERGFHRDITYSSINAYYFLRLIDNAMDGHGDVEKGLLPAAAVFHTEFMLVYQRYFEPADPFWDFFRHAWFRTNEAAVRGASIAAFDEADFRQVTVAKLTAAQIPIAATAHRANRSDVIARWLDFCSCLAHSFQMLDDVFDWQLDIENRQGSYFLSEACRRKLIGESVESWVIREGLSWGLNELMRRWQKLYEASKQLESPALSSFLIERGKQLERDRVELCAGFRGLSQAARILELGV
jgi:hypothetical protein